MFPLGLWKHIKFCGALQIIIINPTVFELNIRFNFNKVVIEYKDVSSDVQCPLDNAMVQLCDCTLERQCWEPHPLWASSAAEEVPQCRK